MVGVSVFEPPCTAERIVHILRTATTRVRLTLQSQNMTQCVHSSGFHCRPFDALFDLLLTSVNSYCTTASYTPGADETSPKKTFVRAQFTLQKNR